MKCQHCEKRNAVERRMRRAFLELASITTMISTLFTMFAGGLMTIFGIAISYTIMSLFAPALCVIGILLGSVGFLGLCSWFNSEQRVRM